MKELLNKIKQKGYWKVEIRPTVFEEKKISSVAECKKLIQDCLVSLRGWNYPHIDKIGIKTSGNDNVESFCNWVDGGYFEYWRFYQSAQFVHYFSMREDYRLSDEKKSEIRRWLSTKSDKFLSIVSTLYSVTEIFEFTKRLAEKGVLGEKMQIHIELHDVEDRELFFWDSFTRSLSRNYICHFRGQPIIIEKEVTKDELVIKSAKLALDASLEIFRGFNWDSVNEQIFYEDQKKLFERRI